MVFRGLPRPHQSVVAAVAAKFTHFATGMRGRLMPRRELTVEVSRDAAIVRNGLQASRAPKCGIFSLMLQE
jgi:predicted secreted Zn-dependent protease